MYVSPVVRQIRDNPTAGADVTLRLVLSTGDSDDPTRRLAETIHDHGGRIDENLPYGSLKVTVPEPAVAVICTVDGIEAVETASVLGGGDAGEDVRFDT